MADQTKKTYPNGTSLLIQIGSAEPTDAEVLESKLDDAYGNGILQAWHRVKAEGNDVHRNPNGDLWISDIDIVAVLDEDEENEGFMGTGMNEPDFYRGYGSAE